MVNTKSNIFCLLVCYLGFCGFSGVSEAVHIRPAKDPIRTKDSDGMVTLPCNFITETYESPQITWYQERGTDRRLIMQYDVQNHLSSYGEFLERVSRGDRGALVVFRPTSRDSGRYTCEVEVDNENPSWTKNTVNLTVENDNSQNNSSCLEAHHYEASKGVIAALAVYWLIALVCTFMLGKRGIDNVQHFRRQLLKRPLKLLFGLVLQISLLVVGLCLTAGGSMCIVYALSSNSIDEIQLFETLGFVVGITGLVILVPTTFALGRLAARPLSVNKERKDHECAGSKKPNGSLPRESREEEESALVQRYHSALDVSGGKQPSDEAPVLQTPKPRLREGRETEATIYGPPGEEHEITGIASTSFRELLVCTTRGLFRMDLKKDAIEGNYTKVKELREKLLTMTATSGRVTLCARYKQRNMFVDIEDQFCVLLFRSDNDDDVTEIAMKNPISWAGMERAGHYLFVADLLEGKIVKFNVHGEKQEVIGERILKKPTAFVQNSHGHLIVVDESKNDIFVFDERGEFLNSMRITVPKYLETQVNGCNRLAIGPDDKIYAASPSSRDILVFSAEFRFEKLLPLDAEKHDIITCLLVEKGSLYVAHKDCLRVYALR